METEAIVNSRPLTPVSDDPTDLEAVTPNNFLIGRANPEIPPDTAVDETTTHRKRWRLVQYISQQMWKRFRLEYIPQLSPRAKWRRPVRQICENDIVLITDDKLPRCQWSLGRVIKPLPGEDGTVRVAEIRTAAGTSVRPVSRLCLLEAQE